MNDIPRTRYDSAAEEYSSADESPLTRALVHFSELQEAGLLGTREDFLKLYPDIRDDLEECLSQADQLHRLASTISECVRTPHTAHLPLSTHTVLGDYEIVRPVGQGGMGTVYEARQISAGRRLALKVLHACSALDPKSIARFHNEIQVAALLEHPHIVNVLDVGEQNGIHYYTMQFIEGQSLAEVKCLVQELHDNGQFAQSHTRSSLARLAVSMPLKKEARSLQNNGQVGLSRLSFDYYRVIAELGLQAARGLHYAHQQGIVHRDIKPSNLMIDLDGDLWITDFGLARIENALSLTLTGDLLGTLRFMSPEQMNTDRALVDHRSDIYSLGATLYELATLSPLVNGTKREAIMYEVLYGSPLHPSVLQRNFPRSLETILLKATAKDPHDRYASCQDMADDLDRFLKHRPVHAKRPTLSVQIWRWTQRNPEFATLTAVFTLVATLGLMLSIWWIGQARYQSHLERAAQEHQKALAQAAQANLALHADVSESIIAFQAWTHHNYPLLRQIAQRWARDQAVSGFERNFLSQVARYKPMVLHQSDGEFYCIRLNPDETKLLCGGTGGMVMIARATGEVLARFQEHRADVNGVAWSHDGNYISSAGDDGCLNIYRLTHSPSGNKTWTHYRTIRVDGALVQVEFIANSTCVAACERITRHNGQLPRNALHVWNLEDDSKHSVLTGPERDTEGLSVSKDGRLAAVACRDQFVWIWDLEELRLLHRLPIRGNGRAEVVLTSVAFAHTTNLLAVGSRDGTLQLFDGEHGHWLQTLDSTETIETIAFEPNDRRLSIGTRQGLTRIFEPDPNHVWLPTSDFIHSQGLWSQVFSSEGKLWGCGRLGLIECVDCQSLVDRRRFPIGLTHLSKVERSGSPVMQASTILNLQFAPDGNSLAFVSNDQQLVFCEFPTGQVISTASLQGQNGLCVAFSSSGQHLAVRTDANRIQLFQIPNLQSVGDPIAIPEAGWGALAFCNNDRLLLTTLGPFEDNTQRQSSIHGFEVPSMLLADDRIPKLLQGKQGRSDFSPQALSALADEITTQPTTKLSTGDLEELLKVKPIKTVLAKHGQFVSLCLDNTIRVFRIDSAEQPLVIHAGSSHCGDIAVSPDGILIAVVTHKESLVGTIRLFHSVTGRELFAFPHYLSNLNCLSFCPDGRSLLAAGSNVSNQAEIVIWGGD